MRFSFLVVIILTGTFVRAQHVVRQSPWQQRVDHCITVALNDTLHRLLGDSKVTYTNNSPDTLKEIWYHLWPNAYSARNTRFAEQFLENGKLDFEFAKEDELGSMTALRFRSEGKNLEAFLLDENHPDVVRVVLPKPLHPGESIIITTPFDVKIPGRFSRFGHNGDSYQITQWYPKPAVYDVNGWNPMPYLDQGEFYSEFGSFEVHITVPSNYVVAATGQLRTSSEWEFIQERINNPIDPEIPIASSPETKSLLFIQDSIHDFAWFASKYFNIEHESMSIDGRTVHTYGYAADKKVDLVAGIQQGLNFYSKHVGPYPYSYCSAVIGPLEAGGGMEYPMITVLSVDTREVVVHEVGHNWFYGILGSNERRYPWMDESINSYFDHECMRLFPFSSSASIEKPSYFDNLLNINDLFMELIAMDAERKEQHQAIGSASEDFTEMNYGTMVYGKGAFLFRHLRRYLGDEVFSKCFHTYYETWKFRHPLPGDMQDVFEQVSGENLSWFFEDLINSSSHVDYKVDRLVGSYLTIESKGALRPPFVVGLYSNGELVHELSVAPAVQGKIGVQLPTGMEYDLVKIDPYQELFEINRRNNSIRRTGLAPKFEPLALNFLFARENPNTTQLFYAPVVGWNIWDKWMPGLYLGNTTFPSRNWDYRLMPMYSFANDQLNGAFHLSYSKYRPARIWKTEIGVKGKRYSFERLADPYVFQQIRPFASWSRGGSSLRSTTSAKLDLTGYFNQFQASYDEDSRELSIRNDKTGRMEWLKPESDYFLEAKLRIADSKVIAPRSTSIRLLYGNYRLNSLRRDTLTDQNIQSNLEDMFLQLSLEHEQKFVYDRKGKGIKMRLFGSYFLDAPDDGYYQIRTGTQAGAYDYLFDQWLAGRGARNGLFSRQMVPNGPNIWLPGNFGNISSWIAALDLEAELPVKLPLSCYADVFTFNDIKSAPNNKNEHALAFSAGLGFQLIPQFLEIRLPLANSEFLNETMTIQGFDKWQERITFRLNLNLIDPSTIGEMIF